MEPTIHTGSMIFVKPEADYNVGDIVTRKTDDPKITITHRIAEKKDDDGRITFRTKGDANDGNDMEDVAKGLIIGKEIFKIPYLGYPVSYAKTVQGLILLIVVPAIIIIYDEAQKIKKEILLKIDYRRRIKKREEGEDKEEDIET
jgi:signal peptidase